MMMTSAYLIAQLSAATLSVMRMTAAGLHAFGKALLAAMEESREREAARMIERHRQLLDHAGFAFERTPNPRGAHRAGDRPTADQSVSLERAAQVIAWRFGHRKRGGQ